MKAVLQSPDHSIPTQGDILHPIEYHLFENPVMGIILSPRCDIEQEKVDYLKFAIVIPADGILRQKQEYIDWISNRTPDEISGKDTVKPTGSNKIYRVFKKYIFNQNIGRFYYLIPFENYGYLAIDFQAIWTLKQEQITDADVIAQMQTPDREDMLQSYVGYAGRVGTEDLSLDDAHSITQNVVKSINLSW